MRCSSCGAENDENRFYCGVCGSSLRPSDVAGEAKPVTISYRDLHPGPATVILVGVALMMLTPAFYIVAHNLEFADTGVYWIPGLATFFLGIFLNWSQGMPASVRASTGLIVVGAASSLAVVATIGAASIVTLIGPPGPNQLKIVEYPDMEAMSLLSVPLSLLPIIAIFGLWTRQRWGLVGGVVVPILAVLFIAAVLRNYTEMYMVVFLSLVYLGSIPLLLAASSRVYFGSGHPTVHSRAEERHPLP